jgi:ABC-type multidrug transport system ATPase subunit
MHELHVDSVCKSFGNTQVLSDIYISCRPGEIIGLLGRNGCGKSTLLKIIFGSISADNKFVRINGTIVQTLAESKNKIAYLPQNNFLPGHLSISKIVDLFCAPSEITALKNDEHVKPFLHRKSRELSGGERRMIEILLIIHIRAEYILIDEPFNGVEPLYKEEVKKILQAYRQRRGFIITDHDYRNILAIATKVILLRDGSIKEIKIQDELMIRNYLPELNGEK